MHSVFTFAQIKVPFLTVLIKIENISYQINACLIQPNVSLLQAAEKALKAAQYTIDANKTSVHNLATNCIGLNDSELTELACQLQNLVGDSTRMRYPDRMHFPQIPNDVYSDQTAQQALQLAKKIVERVQYRIS